MTTPTLTLDVNNTAIEICNKLKRDFPKTNFEAKAEIDLGMGNFTLQWVDGPTAEEVDAAVREFWNQDLVNYIWLSRGYTPEAYAAMANQLAPLNEGLENDKDELHRQLRNESL